MENHIRTFENFNSDDVNKISTEKLKEFFEQEDFKVDLFEQDNVQVAEIEKWTDGGVDMIIVLNPFTKKEFAQYVEDFNTDELIDLHRQDNRYKEAFTIRESLDDFTAFHDGLKETLKKLEKI